MFARLRSVAFDRTRIHTRLLILVTLVAAPVALAFVAVRSGVLDGIPRPWRPSAEAQFPSANECGTCHPAQLAAWQASPHARAVVNPLVHASICGRCHAPVGTMLDAEYQLKAYDRTPMPGMPSSAAEGVTCIVCHSPVTVPEEQVLTFLSVWPNWRTSDLALQVHPAGTARGPFGTGAPGDPAPVANASHASVPDASLAQAETCRTCHDVVVDKGPLSPHCGIGAPQVKLLTTYDEWASSPYGDTTQTCQSCHMPQAARAGPAAVAPPGTKYDRALPPRPLADHSFTGVSTEYLRAGPDVDRQEALVAEHVKDAAAIELVLPHTVTPGEALEIGVNVTNTGTGHELPTGFAYWSEAWLEVTATDGAGRRLVSSGDVDDEGWLRDEFNPRVRSGALPYDADLLSLRARLVTVGVNRTRWLAPDGTVSIPPGGVPHNRNGTPIIGTADYDAAPIVRQVDPGAAPAAEGATIEEGYVLRFADTVLRNGIAPQRTRAARYRVTVPQRIGGPVTVSARLLIRSLWPWMLRQQEELPTPRPRPRIYEIAGARQAIRVTVP
jgi:hypothetical protein